MSCTLVLVPVAMGTNVIAGLVTALVSSTVLSIAKNNELAEDTKNAQYDLYTSYQNSMIADALTENHSHQYQTFCSEYETVFKDEQLLLKTLNEHFVENITTNNGKIYGNYENIQFEFEKNNNGLYVMHIEHKENENLDIVKELGEEYQLNVQEQSYKNIKKNLEKQNLKIDTEEVLEDNSIMLTVNLE